MKTCVIVFLKEPKEKEVKTRLAKQTSFSFATNFYKKCLEDITNTLETFEVKYYSNTGFVYEGIQTHIQQGSNLGQKMFHALNEEFNNGYDNIVLIGTDTPHLEAKCLKKSFEVLLKKPCVIGPCDDGGYYLIGFQKMALSKEYFENIAWSTPSVLESTLQKLHKNEVYLLKYLNDIDTKEDLNIFYKEYQNSHAHLNTIAFLKDTYETV